TSNIGDVRLPKAIVPAKATRSLEIHVNLDSRLEVGKPFDIKDPNGTSQYSTGVEIYDSQGNKHRMMVHFNKLADRTWEWHGLVDGKQVVGGKPGEMSEVAKGRITFTVDGKLDTQEVTNKNFTFAGGALPNQDIKVSFGDAITTDKG